VARLRKPPRSGCARPPSRRSLRPNEVRLRDWRIEVDPRALPPGTPRGLRLLRIAERRALPRRPPRVTPRRHMKISLRIRRARTCARLEKLADSRLTTKLWRRAGNAASRKEANCVCSISRTRAVNCVLQGEKVDFVWSRSEAAAVAGHRDDLRPQASRHRSRDDGGASLQARTGFTKALCRAHNIPDRRYEAHRSPSQAYARNRAGAGRHQGGRACGRKGASRGKNLAEAEAAIDMMFPAGLEKRAPRGVLEEFRVGEEALVFALCDGETEIPLASAQGPQAPPSMAPRVRNGGMGAFRPRR